MTKFKELSKLTKDEVNNEINEIKVELIKARVAAKKGGKVKKKFGKIVTLVSGIEKGIDIKKIARELKEQLGCGGTIKDNVIELQGDHRRKIKPILVSLGFSENTIII